MTHHIDDALLAQAIDFHIRLDSDHATSVDYHACQAWRDRSREHERAWQAVQQRLGICTEALRSVARQMPDHAEAVKDILTVPNRSRRVMLGVIVGALGTGAAATLENRWMPLTTLAADYATRTAERRTWQLADGSRLMLDARSSADVTIDASTRHVALRQGQAMLDVAAGANRFTASDDNCRVQVPEHGSGVFAMRRAPQRTLLVALRGDLIIEPAQGDRLLLVQGQGCWVGQGRLSMLDAQQALAETAWRQGRLEVLDQPLSAIVEALQKYRIGYIRLHPDAAQIHVQGVLSLDNTEMALDSLAQTLPLTIERYGPWLAVIRRNSDKRNKT